ncbi:DUF4091 domain-containing protein [Paenibacillus beijingensis]|uniref:Glycoside hydrolase 123 catalytic domain-containing protein n=1 Tax=Paenibacillus beijingensis TaxID=1126833 RepID=A0A0D5NHL7_9BACL|nr:DUF4091 domain-containing protein [Paenibacillus beijingensis]AJY74756.1 hypothetical protein VN24_09365 [Paenibacillus beijingensis]
MQNSNTGFETVLLSSLSKVFADGELEDKPCTSGTALRKEVFSFQLAYRSARLLKQVTVRLVSDILPNISVRTVGLVPSELPCYHDHDDNVLRSSPGLYPDPLLPLRFTAIEGSASFVSEAMNVYPAQWRSLWISVDVTEDMPQGSYPIRLTMEAETGEQLAEETFDLTVIGAALPEQRLIHTEWFHTDCLATHYKVDVFNEEHWSLIERYVQTAVRHGINMILTPLFTPPLDTAVGGERPTVQLVDVQKDGDTYTFGFARLLRWVELCRSSGVKYFEFSHLFTQWGAKHAPKIIAAVDGEAKQIFGWETDAAGEAYAAFLRQLLPELTGFIREHGLEGSCYFHVSDEPHLDHLESYGKASALVRDLLADFPVIDALSDYAFYEKGLVRKPVPSNDHIGTFIENGVPDLWTYYCCLQYKQVSNRFFNMPSVRNRMMGWQLYKYNIEGFLHWGYNFWYTQHSLKQIDPYRVTDAGGAFPSGDSFLVYPGEDGYPVESVRLSVFREALQDLRALQLLERLIGRERTLALVEEELLAPLTFTEAPADLSWLLRRRARVNALIREAAGQAV